MSKKTEQLGRLREIVDTVCLAHGLELVDARFVTDRGAVLRVLIERPGTVDGSGVTLSDCQAVSRDLSTALDVEDAPTPGGAYRLEVSSPGVERPLFGARDYERFAGREVKLQTQSPHGGRRRFTGILEGIEGDLVTLTIDGERVSLPHGDITKAHLVFRF